jgi:peptidoglycan/xylan/chitin deacetylase (PgdA/CDA1 family)
MLPTLPVAEFDRQMQHLVVHYDLMRLDEAVAYLSGEGTVHRRGVVVTFDDGYADNFRYAMPVLLRYNVPATFFIATEYVNDRRLFWWDQLRYAAHSTTRHDRGRPLADRLQADAQGMLNWDRRAVDDMCRELNVTIPPSLVDEMVLSWSQIREMYRAGFAFGSHTHTHPYLPRIRPQCFCAELATSRDLLDSQVPGSFRPFAFPMGDHDPAQEELVRAAGYDCAVTINQRPYAGAPCLFRLGRVHETGDFSKFELHAAGVIFPGWESDGGRHHLWSTVHRPGYRAQM